MIQAEPELTAILLAAFGTLAGISALFSRASGRIGIPVALVFLALGVLAGLSGFELHNYHFAFQVGVAALALILFDGGLNTPMSALRPGIWPASVLATLGVAGTAAVVGLGARLFGLGWLESFLLGAIVSSTDAAAVFSVLRGSGLQLKRRVGVTLELESGLNDPMAVILTLALTEALMLGRSLSWHIVPEVFVQLALGAVAGLLAGYLGKLLLVRAHLPATGLYAVLTLAIAFLSFGVTTIVGGSGFVAVYLTAVVLGNGPVPYKSGLLRVHDAVAWLSQVVMFLVLGLLVDPRQLLDVAWIGLGVALLLAFVARPLVVALCLAPFGYPRREVAYIGWVGLRGAIPIVLATFPILAGLPNAQHIFNIVFFVVVVNALVPGGTVRYVTSKLGLVSHEPPAPQAVLEIASTRVLKGELLSFFIEPASAVSGEAISQLPFPPGTSVMLIVRGEELLAPKGATVMQPGDHVYLFCAPDERPFVQLMFGRLEQE